VRRAKLYYLRGKFGKQAKMKNTEAIVPESAQEAEAASQ